MFFVCKHATYSVYRPVCRRSNHFRRFRVYTFNGHRPSFYHYVNTRFNIILVIFSIRSVNKNFNAAQFL